MLFNRWAVSYQRMMSFEEFKQQLGVEQDMGQKVKKQTAEEILSEVRGILNGNI